MMWKGKRRKVRRFRSVISMFVIFCLFMTGSLREYGPAVAEAVEDSKTKYITDIRLFYAPDSLEQAVQKCKDSGFTPADGDLNEGTGRNHVVLGYKETDQKADAICSIRLLSMDAGFEMKDYEKLQEEYENSNASVIDTIEAAALEFTTNYKAGSPKAKQAYEGLNLINVPEADKKLGDYIVSGKADWAFYAKIVTRSSAGTTSAILGYLTTGMAAYNNEYDSKKGQKVSTSWAAKVVDSGVWEDLEEASSEDEFDEMYQEYGDDAKAFHKKLQEFATAYENARASFDEDEYAGELEKMKGESDEKVVSEKEEMSDNEKGILYLTIYEELDQYEADGNDSLAEYLLKLGNETSSEVDLTKLYPVIGSMSYGERRMAGMSGLPALIQTAGENKADEQVDQKIDEAADHIEAILGTDCYSVWMNKNEDIKGKKVAYTSDAIRMNAAQQLIDNQDNTVWEDQANEVMKWVNMALGIVSCLLMIAKFAIVAKVLALIPAAICAIASALGLTSAATTIAAIAGKIAAGATAAGGPIGWITMAVMIVAMLVIWLVSWILKLKKENSDVDYEDAPDYVADRVEGEEGDYLAYYKGAGSEDASDGTISEKDFEEFNVNNLYHGEAGISDVNGRRGFRGWNCIFYSKDTNTGSPIVVQDGVAPFKITTGDGNPINGYDSVNPFGELMPGNCNALMKKDEKGGVYVHYRTEKSVKNATTAGTSEGKTDGSQGGTYYKEIIVRSADTEALAKAKITAKGYKIWDVNLANNARYKYSRKEEWAFTYLGFKTTTSPKQAIRDIRVATYTPESNKEVNFGDIKYGCAGNLGYKAENKTEDKEYPEDLDGLWFTKDERAGTPIKVGGLHSEPDHADGKYVNDGWIPVTTFSGVPYNFASTRDTDTKSWKPGRLGNYGYSYTCYGTEEDDTWNNEARYLYYEPEVKYTSGTKYLSAVFFTFGTDSESTASKVGEVEAKYTQLVDRMKKTPNTVILDGDNLAKSFVYKGFVVESNQKYLHLGYSWSYNPYRALTDIRVYQSTIFANNLPYTITKPSTTGKNYSYVSATVVSQRTAGGINWVLRGIGPENAYMFPSGLLGTNEQVPEGYTGYQPGGYRYSRKHMPFMATGLYVSGLVDGAEKLTLNDVVITKGKHEAKNNGGVITADVSGEKTLSGTEAQGEFNSIQEMKAPHETAPFNIAYPEWTDDDGDHHDAGDPCYIYIRKPALKRKYISKIFVGSSSFDDTGMEEDQSTQQAVGKQVDANALNQANGATPDEVIPVNVGLVKGRAWYDIRLGGGESRDNITDIWGGYYDDGISSYKEDRLPWVVPLFEYAASGGHQEGAYKKEYLDRAASYLSVERTDDPDEAVRGILLFKSNAKTVAERIQVGGVEYYCSSISTPIQMRKLEEGDGDDTEEFRYNWKKEKYFVYYTTNKGVSPGQPITDLDVDEKVFNTKQATVLCVDKKDKVETSKDGRKSTTEKVKPFGEADLPMFIHANYEKESNAFFNKIYVGSGKTEKEALLALLEQGCTEFCDLNLNEGASLTKADIEADKKKTGGEYVYFGYRGFALDEDEIKSKTTAAAKEKERDEQLQDAIYDIVCTIGEPYHAGGFTSEKNQIYYAPVATKDEAKGTNLNVGVQGTPIYMYYTTPWLVKKYNEKAGTDTRKNLSPQPKDYLKSPLTRVCFTQYDRVPYNKDSGVDSFFGDDVRAWEYVLYADNKTPADMNDGAIKFDDDYHTENIRISMFAQREDGSVKEEAEITGGYVSATAKVGEMWLNR